MVATSGNLTLQQISRHLPPSYTAMLSVASLLNPAPSGVSYHRLPPSPAASSPTTSFADETAFYDRTVMPKHRMPKDAAVFTKGRAKGLVGFPPHERLDEASLREVRKYHVFPFGKIQDYCRHIPYNSGKKDFFEKTGRESFEVFQYVFKLPGDETEYAVMWDYNVGLVRMTPFFKCCKYSKTTPAKMLNMNPGLKEITHSITGGSIMAQGYWMPYQCARAVCATFCHHIAGALIPIFGPDFPSLCIPPGAPDHARMIIDPAIIGQSTREADYHRRVYSSMMPPAGAMSPPRDHRHVLRPGYEDRRAFQSRPRVRRPFITRDHPYGVDTDGEVSPITDRGGGAHDHYSYSPARAGAAPARPLVPWHPAGAAGFYDAPLHSPWLSAVPSFARPPPHAPAAAAAAAALPPLHPTSHPADVPAYPPAAAATPRYLQRKRSAEHLDADSPAPRRAPPAAPNPEALTPPSRDKAAAAGPPPVLGPDKNAALLLMNLRVGDPAAKTGGKGRRPGVASATISPVDDSFPRKRVRANSL